MNAVFGRCLAMTVGAVALAALLLAAGVPGALLLGLAPVAVCAGMVLIMGHGDPHGDDLYRTAKAAADRAKAAGG